MAAPEPCKRIFFFTHPRTTSNVLIKMLAKHPQIQVLDYAFHSAFHLGPEKLGRKDLGSDTTTAAHMEASRDETYQRAFDRVQQFIIMVEEQGKVPVIKEHVYFFIDPKVVARNMPPKVYRQGLDRPTIVADPRLVELQNGCLDSGHHSPTPHTNPTLLPDSFLRTLSPVILFRHPARMIPSFYRATFNGGIEFDVDDEDLALVANLRWVRLVFDWYADKVPGGRRYVSPSGEEDRDVPRTWPLVIDGDDLIHEAGAMPRLCEKLGLDPQYLQTSWEKASLAQREAQDPMISSFLATVQDSTGIITSGGRDYDIDLAEEKESFIQEFGSEIGTALARYVEDAMPDYHYLCQFRI